MAMASLMDAVSQGTSLQPVGVEPLRWLISYAESLHLQALLVGLVPTDRGWAFSRNTAQYEILFSAALYVAAQHLGLTGCLSITVAQGIKILQATTADVTSSTTMHWIKHYAENMQYHEQDGCGEIRVDAHLGRGKEWSRTCMVQFRCIGQ